MTTLRELKASAVEQLVESNVAERKALYDLLRTEPYMENSLIAANLRLRIAIRNVALAVLGGPIR